MRRQRQSGTARRARRERHAARRALTIALPLAIVLASMLVASATALPTRNACDAPRQPGRARCLAVQLLVPPSGSAQPFVAPRAGRSALPQGKPEPGFQTPTSLRELYDLPEETAAGSTQTIAVVDAFDDPTIESDLGVYSKEFGLPPCTSANGCFKKVNQKGQSSPLPPVNRGWASEITIDVEMAHAVCQTCSVVLVEAKSEEFSDLAEGVNAAVKLGANEISNSYGSTEETGLSELESSSYNHPGVVLTVSSGDCGYLNRD
jgi:subtilase family serine protease